MRIRLNFVDNNLSIGRVDNRYCYRLFIFDNERRLKAPNEGLYEFLCALLFDSAEQI